MLLNIFEYHIINILNIVEIELNNIGVGHENFNPQNIALKPASNGTCICVCMYNTLLIKIFVSIKFQHLL